MSRLIIVLLALTFSAFPASATSNRKAPEFTFSTVEGKSSLSSLLKSNKVALVYFGDDTPASWEKLSEVNALISEYRYRGSNLETLAFIPGKEPAKLEKLAEEHWLNFDLLPDPEGKIIRSFNIRKYPTITIVDPFGVIQSQGDVPSQDQLREKLNAYVDKPVVKAFCPVDKMWVVVTDKTPSVVYKGSRYYFCMSEDHDGRRMDQEFLQDPERYAKEARLHIKKEREAVEQENAGSIQYECPMKDSPPQNKPGVCPKCGMSLQKVGD